MFFAAAIITLSLFFFVLGTIWRKGLKNQYLPTPAKWPLVSIIIPAYNSSSTIEETLKSVKNLDYPRKEIIVVNESNDSTPQIAEKYGAKIIQNKTRLGKPRSLNKATQYATGEILFYLDSDTIVSRTTLSQIIPWFSKKNIAAVMPRYRTHKSKKFLTRLISFDASFLLSLIRMHMFFGSMIGFRGCSIAVRKSVINEHGGWPNTLVEDNYLGAKIAKSGLTIQYEPRAEVVTAEPLSLKELKKQRTRWGKGSVYSFLHHRHFYMKSPQFLLHNFPYMIIQFAFIIFILINLIFLNFTEIAFNIITVLLAVMIHVALLTWPENKSKKDIILSIPFTLYYLPLVTWYYFAGFFSGLRNKKRGLPELVFKEW